MAEVVLQRALCALKISSKALSMLILRDPCSIVTVLSSHYVCVCVCVCEWVKEEAVDIRL